MKPKEVKKRLEADGWVEQPGGKTSHRNYKHPTTLGKVQVPFHPGDLNPGRLKALNNNQE